MLTVCLLRLHAYRSTSIPDIREVRDLVRYPQNINVDAVFTFPCLQNVRVNLLQNVMLTPSTPSPDRGHVRDLVQYLQNIMLMPSSPLPAYSQYVIWSDPC